MSKRRTICAKAKAPKRGKHIWRFCYRPPNHKGACKYE